jgi:hypothetical protein
MSPQGQQRVSIHKSPEPYFTGTLTQWCNFLESKRGRTQIAEWWDSIENDDYQEIIITQFMLRGRLVVPGSNKTTLRLLKTNEA